MPPTPLLAAAAGLLLLAGAILYAGLRIGAGRRGALLVPESAPVAARRLVGAWQGRQGYAFALAISNAAAADVLIDGVDVLAPGGARLSVQPDDGDRWTRAGRRHAVRWRALAGRDTVVQCRLHLPASAQRAGARVRLELRCALDEPGGRRIRVPLTVEV